MISFISSNIIIFIALIVTAIGVFCRTWPVLLQLLRFKEVSVVSSRVSDFDDPHHTERLVVKLNQQLDLATSAKLRAIQAEFAVVAAEAQVKELTDKYLTAVSGMAPESVQSPIVNLIFDSRAKVRREIASAQEAIKIASQELNAVDRMCQELNSLADRLQCSEQKCVLNALLSSAKEASLALRSINRDTEAAKLVACETRVDSEMARAKSNLVKDSDDESDFNRRDKVIDRRFYRGARPPRQ